MGDSRVACQRLTREYGDAFRLGPLDLMIAPGVTCVVGPNGAGKSTLFRLLAGLEQPSAGHARIVSDAGSATLGYLPQDPDFPPHATCAEFLDYVAWLQDLPRLARPQAVARALDIVGLADRSDQRIKTLSGGMTRRLGIAHALVHDPGLLLLDEPTVALDPRQRVELRATIRKVGEGRIVLVSTHLVEDVRAIADRVLVLDRGDIVFDGDVAALESRASDEHPGDTLLERAITGLMGAHE